MSTSLYEHEEKVMNASLKDSLVLSSPPLDAPIKRRTRAQNLTLTEEERLEEARDTVDDNDIQLTHGMDSECSDKLSPLPVDMPATGIEQTIAPIRRKVGRVGHERTSSLDKMLSSRMTRQMFENKFLAREITVESMCNRQAGLSRLLAQRPSREKLEHNNIIKSGIAPNVTTPTAEQLTITQKRERLSSLIANRPGQLDLTKRNILLPGETMSARSRMMTRVPDAS